MYEKEERQGGRFVAQQEVDVMCSMLQFTVKCVSFPIIFGALYQEVEDTFGDSVSAVGTVWGWSALEPVEMLVQGDMSRPQLDDEARLPPGE